MAETINGLWHLALPSFNLVVKVEPMIVYTHDRVLFLPFAPLVILGNIIKVTFFLLNGLFGTHFYKTVFIFVKQNSWIPSKKFIFSTSVSILF